MDTMLLKVRDAVVENPGCCSNELQALTPGDSALWKRMAEAETAGYVRRGEKRTSRVSGKKCWTWFPVEEGK